MVSANLGSVYKDVADSSGRIFYMFFGRECGDITLSLCNQVSTFQEKQIRFVLQWKQKQFAAKAFELI